MKVYYTSIVKGIALYNGVEWIYHRGSVLEQEMSQDDVGTRIWYAKYTKTDPGDNPDWENLTWTNIGNVIAVTTVEPDEPENSGEPEIRGITMVDPASLPTLTLPGALSQVEAEAFAGSAVQSVKLSDGITAILGS